jgi:hypothetical protein
VTAAALKTWRRDERTADSYELAEFVLGGVALAAAAAIFSMVVDGIALGAITAIWSEPDSQYTLPTTGVIVAMVFAIVFSLFAGYWLISMRRWIGLRGDPTDHDTIRRKRRSFTIGAICGYVVFAPLPWLFILALSGSATW